MQKVRTIAQVFKSNSVNDQADQQPLKCPSDQGDHVRHACRAHGEQRFFSVVGGRTLSPLRQADGLFQTLLTSALRQHKFNKIRCLKPIGLLSLRLLNPGIRRTNVMAHKGSHGSVYGRQGSTASTRRQYKIARQNRVHHEPTLMAVSMSDELRSAHLPQLFADLVICFEPLWHRRTEIKHCHSAWCHALAAELHARHAGGRIPHVASEHLSAVAGEPGNHRLQCFVDQRDDHCRRGRCAA